MKFEVKICTDDNKTRKRYRGTSPAVHEESMYACGEIVGRQWRLARDVPRN